ncbi:tubulin-specific chaperone cofactor E-like protein [Pecten maximus]|uniref:tubulin-specific chaperone cofactor E-like protein n=1 Tax=Pecten maximus TaxID=6579 RepID=UPI001458454C|nr:tubulin-specific chaperone cofactor E-like protein [Pecten maximus]XP_033757929.1 tubulin-specific chaperone cofactor E-like protein [Pecten maximus]XP_033757930.1 tubulin-specific chaperone cofactor E-like protein [Pecten maximus]
MMEDRQTEDFSLIHAINAKYSDEDNTSDFKVYISSNAPGKKDSGGLVIPPILVLDNNRVTCAGPSDAIASLCCRVTELDITNNLFTCWKEVLSMITHIPRLQTLNLTSNTLTAGSLGPDVETLTFPNVNLLILNNTQTTWSSMHTLLKIFPSLSELHLSLNGYASIDVENLETYPSLKKLFINKHAVPRWSKISRLGCVFPNLETLVTIESDLADMISECSEAASVFQCLKCLHISSSKLPNWEHIEELRKIPKLCDIRMKNIPFLEEYNEKVRRQMIIARLPNITHLNVSPINQQEREDAERAFIRFYMDKENPPRRYHELEQTYGKLDHLVDLDLSPKTTCRLIVKMNDDDDDDDGGKSKEMDISITQTVRELKQFLQEFAGLPSHKFRLFYTGIVDEEKINPQELIYPNKFLHTLNISDGDWLVIIPKLF